MIGTKTKATPEIGDLAIMGDGNSKFVFEDYNADTIVDEVPAGASLGAITEIRTNADGYEVYHVENGWVYADEVTTKLNPAYNYGGKTTTGTTGTGTGSSWNDTLQKVLDLAVGIFGKKKGTNPTSNGDPVDGDTVEDPETEKKSTIPTWVWLAIGGVGLTGIVVALAWPKKKEKPVQEPIYIGPKK